MWNPPREGPLEVEDERGREGPEATVEVAGSCPVDRSWRKGLWLVYLRPVTLSWSRRSRLNAQRSVAAGRGRGRTSRVGFREVLDSAWHSPQVLERATALVRFCPQHVWHAQGR